MLSRIIKLFKPSQLSGAQSSKRILASQHGIKTSHVSPSALKVIEKLQQAGFAAYLVGGGVRDLLLNLTPKDFDVATIATPEQTKRLFRNAMIIGRRFRIVHVRFGREIIEVTTFRDHHETASNPKDAEQSHSGMLLRDNVYGDMESDALRRDFSVNAFYYNPANGEIWDFANGLNDLHKRTLTIIGDPQNRYREDPVRMLRAVRFAAKLGFQLEAQTGNAIKQLASHLREVSPARLFEEVLKLLLNGSSTAALPLLEEYRLLEPLFPGTYASLSAQQPFAHKFIEQLLVNTDKRIRQQKKVAPAFLYAAFMWLPLQANIRKLLQDKQITPQIAFQQAEQGVISQQLQSTAIPKRFLIPVREIWALQSRLTKRDGRKAFLLLEHERFRAAYDFLLLREEAGESLQGLGLWWTQFQDADDEQREWMVNNLNSPSPRNHRKPRSRSKPRVAAPKNDD